MAEGVEVWEEVGAGGDSRGNVGFKEGLCCGALFPGCTLGGEERGDEVK